MKKYKIAAVLVLLFSAFSLFVKGEEQIKKEYVAKEDAYIRSGSNAAKNYNYESITSAHGDQYAEKGYRVINSKYQGSSNEIIGMMKFELPTAVEATEKALNRFELQFTIFKNADYNSGDQDYVFRYTTNTSWNESTITWNNRPTEISRTNTDVLFTFHVEKGDEYEFKEENKKVITTDITTTIEKLIAAGHTSITIFITATESLNTSILIHCKETSDEAKKPRIIASNAFQVLKNLVSQVSSLSPENYTTESYTVFARQLSTAAELITNNSTDLTAVRKAYNDLKNTYEALVALSDPNDTGNIAYNKPARSNLSKLQAQYVTDGKLSTSWSGIFFPAYVDVDLMGTYDIEKIAVHFPEGKKTYYTLYGSNDGKNYNLIYKTRDAKPATAEGDLITFSTPKSYRIVRVYIEFTDNESKAYLSEVKVYGTKTDTNTGVLRQGAAEEILGVKPYNETVYSQPITQAEIIENVFGIIDRTIGAEYRDWFCFALTNDNDSVNDYFELSDAGGKIRIKGNKGLSLATGLNYYFKNYVNVHVSEQSMQVKMPEQIVPIGETVRKETPYKIRYAFNYCTLNYTFSFFGEENWQRENDWLALNGVNVVLDLAGQEATWIKFLMNFGYSFDDAKDWLTGPSYYAWQFMDNMETFGGPVPDGYVKDRVELARSTQRWKNSLGIQTVLQGYAGMIPTNFKEFQPDANIVVQGSWNGFSRPYMIATNSAQYDEYARLFYQAQEFIYGKTSNYYAVDPFHEGGIRPSGLTDEIISKEVLESLLEYDENAVWVVQGWQSNPTNGLLKGMGKHRNKHVLIVDLIKYPLKSWTKYNKLKYDNTTLDAMEFNGTNWAWCLLANFGGNPSMHGQMDVMVEDILNAQKTSKHMQGIGIISEAMYENPVLYDLIFDLVWTDADFDLDRWIDKYIKRRYGDISENARLAWKTMRNSNFDHGVRFTNEVFGMKNKGPQSYSSQTIPYGAENLETAFKLLAADFDKFKDSECYRYDMTEIMRQVVSNYAVLTYNDVLSAKSNNSLENFKKKKAEFLNAFDILNKVQATQKEQLGGEWIGKATDLAENYDDFAKATFEMNAKTLITTWGSRSTMGSLKDYGWRNYEGIVLDIYKAAWSEYLDKVEKNMTDGTAIETISAGGYFNFYWDWVMSSQNYTRVAKNSPEELKDVINLVIEKSSLTEGLDPNAGNLALKKAVQANTTNVVGKPGLATDGLADTQVTVSASMEGTDIVYPEITVDLIAEFQISKVNLVLDNADDTFYHYEIYTSADGQSWEKAAEKKTDALHANEGDTIVIDDNTARFVKVRSVKDSKHTGDLSKTEITVKESRIYGERVLPTLLQLERLINAVQEINFSANTEAQISRVNELLGTARTAFNNSAPPDDLNTVYWSLYDYIVSLDLSALINIAKGKPVSAHNDPGGNSQRVADGDTGTYWDSGRLSATGLPYEETITPGWAIIDLGAVYTIDEIRLKFAKSTIWHMYEIYGSLNNGSWTKIAEKTTQTTPNNTEDSFFLKDTKARYIKIATTNIQLEGGGKRSPYHVSEIEVYGNQD